MTTTTVKPATTGTSPKTKPAKAKPPANKQAPKKPAKPAAKKGTATKRRLPRRKDAPIMGELAGKSLANYKAVLKVTPPSKDKALNANKIAALGSMWPIPTKRYLETGVHRGDIVKVTKDGRTLYHRKGRA